MDPLAILALAVAALLLLFRLSLSTKGAKKARDEETADDTVPPAGRNS